jgi:hypothetical protein
MTDDSTPVPPGAAALSHDAEAAAGQLSVHSVALRELIGAVALWGAEIEGMLTVVFTQLAGGDQRVSTLLARGQDFMWLHDRCVDMLALQGDQPWVGGMKDALADAKRAMEARNRVIHATWWPAQHGGLLGARPRRNKPVDVFPVTAETLRSDYLALTAAWSRLLMAYYAAAGIDPSTSGPVQDAT